MIFDKESVIVMYLILFSCQWYKVLFESNSPGTYYFLPHWKLFFIPKNKCKCTLHYTQADSFIKMQPWTCKQAYPFFYVLVFFLVTSSHTTFNLNKWFGKAEEDYMITGRKPECLFRIRDCITPLPLSMRWDKNVKMFNTMKRSWLIFSSVGGSTLHPPRGCFSPVTHPLLTAFTDAWWENAKAHKCKPHKYLV